MLVDGSYFEEIAGRRFDYRPLQTGFHPADTLHRDGIGSNGGRFVCLELTPQMTALAAPDLGKQPIVLRDELSIPMARTWRAFAQTGFSPLLAESLVWELIGAVSRLDAAVDRRHPTWLSRCIELIRAEYGQALTVQEIAHRVGVHPVHLSREFRRRFGQTVGEYMHEVRVRSACVDLWRDEKTLADIAANTGFADQSHFCRVFKHLIGCNPSQFRLSAIPARRRAS